MLKLQENMSTTTEHPIEWSIDKTALIELLGKTIYRPENVLVEIAANSYDADASIVKIISSGENQKIQILDNGCGMDKADLKILTTIAKSKKKDFVENEILTPVFARQYLGSFGIGIISFLSLGNKITIFTKKNGEKSLCLIIQRKFNEDGKTDGIPISEVQDNDDFSMHLIDGNETVSGTTIEIENTKLDLSNTFNIIKYKLSNLPLSSNFKVELNNSDIKKDDYPNNNWESKEFKIKLEDLDPTYISPVDLHVYYNPDNPNETIPSFKRGIFLRVHGRVIEHNLYQRLRPNLTSPGSIDSRITGFVEADYLFTKIQANREDFFDDRVIERICDQLKDQVQNLINDFLLIKNLVSEDVYLNSYNRLRDIAIERIQNVHSDLARLGLKFKYSPNYEQEVVIIIAELCQLKLLEFEIISSSGGSHIDCLVQWNITQSRRMPDFVGHLEIETSLHKFLLHQHDYRTKPEIICWEIDEVAFEREAKKYKKNRPESIESIELITPSSVDKEHFKHQKELQVKIRTKHDETVTKILRVYNISEIVRTAINIDKNK
ncbi:MAG: hypothetical protein EOO44_18605 [Flavobacterium sp.]|nr:MAG: hypothetical protein EOO44_18605 [Flavobacterium sp.]